MISNEKIILDVLRMNGKLGALGSKISQFGLSTVVVTNYTIGVIVIEPIGGLVPIEIRYDKDTLGWLYDKQDRHILVSGSNETCRLKDLLKIVEAGVKKNKKATSTTPEEFKLLRSGESIWTFISVDTLKTMLLC